MAFFVQTAEHIINNSLENVDLENLPDVIGRHTDFKYSYQRNDKGCLLKPIFKGMNFKNSFVPEIKIVASRDDDHIGFKMIGKPVKQVCDFIALWVGFLFVVEVMLIISALTSNLNGSYFVLLIPFVMCAFGFIVCEFATKLTFNSIVKVIKEELSEQERSVW